MTDRENEQAWAIDPQVARWLGESTDNLTPEPTTSAESEPDSAQSGDWSPDNTVWAQNAAVSGWLVSDPSADTDRAGGPAHHDESTASATSGSDTDITAPMSVIRPQRKQPLPDPQAAVRSTVAATAPPATDAGAESSRRSRRPSRRTAAMGAAVVAAAVLVFGLVIAVAAVVGDASDDSGQPIAQPPVPSAAIEPPATPAQDADCPNRSENGVVTGRDPGGTTSGPAVIKAFEHAYYVDRDGTKARSYGTELARIGSAATMQAFIDNQLPPGTLHCTRITDRGAGLWSLELSEIPPGGGEPVLIRQLVQTAEVDGRTLITAITADTNQ